jgi:hypothetical protein
MKTLFLLSAVLLSGVAFAQQPPDTEIYVFDLSVKKNMVSISHPINITAHPGYDNQPFFHPGKPLVYYTSAREDGRTDIMSYNYKDKRTIAVTQTPEREYSPTVTLDQQFLSCIIQRDNDAQDLGKYDMEGGDAFVIIDHLKVGYHVWVDNSHLGLFVLGNNGSPNTLHYLLLPIKRDTILAENIGRSLHRVPGETAFSFVQKAADGPWQIKKYNAMTHQVTTIGPTLPSSEDLCWTNDGKILMGDGKTLFFLQPGPSSAWQNVKIESGAEVLKKVSRIAVSADGKKLAVVVTP